MVSTKKAVICIILAAVILLSVAFAAFSLIQPITNNPVEIAAREKSLPDDIVSILSPLGENGTIDRLYTDKLLEGLAPLGDYLHSSTVQAVLSDIVSDKNISWHEVQWATDIDMDYITNELEVTKYNTDPTRAETLGLGLPDFFAVYVYKIDPNNATAIKEFLTKIPNVKAENFRLDDGGYWKTWEQIIQLSTTDPLIDALDKQIVWIPKGQGQLLLAEAHGIIYLGGEPLVKQYGDSGTDTMVMPSYFITHGRIGTCVPSNVASLTILKSMGYNFLDVDGKMSADAELGHDWSEVVIDGTLYVESNGFLIKRDGFYEKSGWIPDEPYYSDWYIDW